MSFHSKESKYRRIIAKNAKQGMLFQDPAQILNTAIHKVILDTNMRIPETARAILILRHAIERLDKTPEKGAQ